MKNKRKTISAFCILSTISLLQTPAFGEPTATKANAAPDAKKTAARLLTPEGKEIEKKIEERDFPEALNLLNKYLQKHPTNVPAYLRRGLIYQTMGKHSQALIDFGTAIKLDPKCIPAYIYRSGIYMRLNQNERAKQDLLILREIDPARFKAIETQKLDNAFKKVDALKSQQNKKYPFLTTFKEARAAGFAGDYDKSYRLFDQLIKDMPAHKAKFGDKKEANLFAALCYYNRSYWFLTHQRYEYALNDLNTALENYPNYHDALMNRAKLYDIIKNPALAKKDRDRAAEIEKLRKTNPNFGL